MGFLRKLILGSDRAALEDVLNVAEKAEREYLRAMAEYENDPTDANAQAVKEKKARYLDLGAKVNRMAPPPWA